MLAAAIDAVAEVGYARMTVAQVIARARVSRKTFYDVFDDREDCFLAVFEQTALRAGEAMGIAREAAGGGWRDGVRAGLSKLLEMMDEEPQLARLCVVEALGAGERVLARRAAMLASLEAVVDGAPRAAHGPPPLTAQGVVGAVFYVLHNRLLEPDGTPLVDLLGSLMGMIVLPYLGPRAAEKEVARAARPAAQRSAARGTRGADRRADPLQGVNMRLTYRTVRVLTVIAEHPNASNRTIAALSGVADQGQISKLLARLSKLGLIANFGEGQERGAANAWQLTPRGAQVERAARPR
jgi:AcrR family transcriptional regulator